MQQRRQQPQVVGGRRLAREQRQHALMDLEVAPVDPVVVGDDHAGQLDVLVVDRLERAVELGDDQVEAAERLLLERLEVGPEAVAYVERVALAELCHPRPLIPSSTIPRPTHSRAAARSRAGRAGGAQSAAVRRPVSLLGGEASCSGSWSGSCSGASR